MTRKWLPKTHIAQTYIEEATYYTIDNVKDKTKYLGCLKNDWIVIYKFIKIAKDEYENQHG